MGDRERDGVGHGSHGQLLYDPDGSKWTFERSTGQSLALYPVGEPQIIHENPAEDEISSFDDQTKLPPSVRLLNQTKALIAAAPELHAAADLLAPLTRVSEAATRAVARHDPSKSNLLVTARISDQGFKKPAQIVAHVTGPTGSDLRLSQIQTQTQGWDGARLEVPIVYGESTVWEGPGAPIQGFVVAQPNGRGETYLAIRLLTKTVILSPVLRRAVKGTKPRLEASLVCELSYAETGQSPHADVAFDPWTFRRIAFVDGCNLWSVWDLPDGHRSSAHRVCYGALDDGVAATKSHVVDDGWARIIWILDTTLIAVCNRRQLKICEVSDGVSFESRTIDAGLQRNKGWILDLAALHATPRLLFTLTSTHLLLYSMNRRIDTDLEVRQCLRIHHYRYAEDISLRLRLFGTKNDIIVLISSDIDPVVTTYTLHISDDQIFTIDDAVELDCASYMSLEAGSRRPVDLHISQVCYAQRQRRRVDGNLGAEFGQETVQSRTILVLDSAFSLHQCLCATTPDLHPPTWQIALLKSAATAAADDSVIDDEDIEASTDAGKTGEPESAYVRHRRAQARSSTRNQWTLGYELCVQRLNSVDVSQVTDVDEVLEEARDALQTKIDLNTMPLKTLRELAEDEVTISDLECAGEKLKNMQQLEHNGIVGGQRPNDDAEDGVVRSWPAMHAIALPSAYGDMNSVQIGAFQRSHRTLRDVFLNETHKELPELLQYTREQLAQRMAAELTLASQVFRIERAEPERPVKEEPESQTWQLPTRSAHLTSSQLTPPDYYDTSSQLQPPHLPTPSASTSAPRSTATASSYSAAQTSEQITRLSRYTTFTPTSAPSALPRRLNRVLAHWTPGADPSTYDYRTTARSITQHESQTQADDDLTERDRLRVQRKAEKQLRRQRREAEAGDRMRMLSNQAPEIVVASQPRQAINFASQQTQGDSQPAAGYSQEMAASQVLPGRHGGRAPVKKRRKVGGF